MVFGDKQGGGLSGIRSALRDEGAVSENARLSHIKRLRDEEEARRAKSSITEKKRQLERNKTEMSHRETEARRLAGELVRAQGAVTEIEAEMKTETEKVGKLIAKYNDLLVEINRDQDIVGADKSKMDKETQTLNHYQEEIKALEQRMTREKDLMREAGKDVEHLTMKMAHLKNDANKIHTDFMHANVQKQYKEREKEARKRALRIVEEKKAHEASEVQRLQSENARLEQEIKSLDQKTHMAA